MPEKEKLHIFISYRRDDSPHAAGRLYDRLCEHFASDHVFMDIDAIDLGVDFRNRIEEAISACDVVIALIGKNWLNATDTEGRRRLDNPNDFVRLELVEALNRNVHVIPALVEGATMPAENKLPQELRWLVRRNGLELGHTRFNADVAHLIKGLEALERKRSAREGPPLRERQTEVRGSDSEPSKHARRSDDNEEARQLYKAGRYFSTRRTAEGLRQAIERFERAVELDPGLAIAHAELADCYSLLNWYVAPPPPGAWERAKEAAKRAVEADPELAEAHASLGFVRLHFDRDWQDAERELRTAIVLKPNNQLAHRWYAYSLSAMGRHDEAYTEMERARQISPQSAVIASGVANVLFLAGRYEEAITQCSKALELDPGTVSAYTVLRWSYEQLGMHQEALAAFEQEKSFAGDTPTTRAKHAHVLAAVGRHEEAREILEELLKRRDEDWVTAYEIAIIYSLLDDRDQALEWLVQAEREHAVGLTFVDVDPNLSNLRSDPRFAELLRETN